MAQGFAVFAGIAPDVIRAVAREAESHGYRSFWVNHPGATDGLVALAHAGEESRRTELGVGVIPLHTRGPASIVEGVKANALPLDRLLLGVGSPNPGALARVRDGVAALRGELSTRIVVAALGPKMCRLAGEVADGVLFNWLTPEHARRSAALVREGAQAAGRRAPTTYAYVRVAIGAAGRDRLVKEGGRYAAIPAYADHFARMRVDPMETCVGVATPEEVPAALARWNDAVDHVVVRAIPARDTVEDHVVIVRAARPTAT